MNDQILQTLDLAIGYNPRGRAVIIADHIDVSIRSGEMVCLIGPNGAGKSTLLRTLAGMQPALHGHVNLLADDVHRLNPRELAKRLSIVLTERVNVGMLSAYALVALGRHPYTDWAGKLTVNDERVVRWALEAVGAVKLAHKNVNELSDGERQKIMIARALAQETKLMILDEPTAFLDLPRRVEIMRMLRQLAHSTGKAILLSTHDLDLALRSADRIWLLPSAGRLKTGAPEDLVLSGAFEDTFRTEGVEFDIYTGSFRINPASIGRIALLGDGIPAVWTQRALEREGFTVSETPSDSPIQVEIQSENGHIGWKLTSGGGPEHYETLYELIQSLKQEAVQGMGRSST